MRPTSLLPVPTPNNPQHWSLAHHTPYLLPTTGLAATDLLQICFWAPSSHLKQRRLVLTTTLNNPIYILCCGQVRAIGRCAVTIESAAEKCVNVLLELIATKVNYVVQEAIIVIKVMTTHKRVSSVHSNPSIYVPSVHVLRAMIVQYP